MKSMAITEVDRLQLSRGLQAAGRASWQARPPALARRPANLGRLRRRREEIQHATNAGQSLIVWAIAEGRSAARGVDASGAVPWLKPAAADFLIA
jgi:hypothetical protein